MSYENEEDSCFFTPSDGADYLSYLTDEQRTWESPVWRDDVIERRQALGPTIQVPEMAMVDFDDTQVSVKLSMDNLCERLERSGTGIDIDELRQLAEVTRGFSPYTYIREKLGEDADEALWDYRTDAGVKLPYADVGSFYRRLQDGGVPNFSLTYGVSPDWQYDKIRAANPFLSLSWMGVMIVPERDKGSYVDAIRFDEGYQAQTIKEIPPARFVAETPVLIDDNLQSFRNWPGRGFWLRRPEKAGAAIPDIAEEELPNDLQEITSLDEIVVANQRLVQRSSVEGMRALAEPTGGLALKWTMNVVPVLNHTKPIGAGITVAEVY